MSWEECVSVDSDELLVKRAFVWQVTTISLNFCPVCRLLDQRSRRFDIESSFAIHVVLNATMAARLLMFPLNAEAT